MNLIKIKCYFDQWEILLAVVQIVLFLCFTCIGSQSQENRMFTSMLAVSHGDHYRNFAPITNIGAGL